MVCGFVSSGGGREVMIRDERVRVRGVETRARGLFILQPGERARLPQMRRALRSKQWRAGREFGGFYSPVKEMCQAGRFHLWLTARHSRSADV